MAGSKSSQHPDPRRLPEPAQTILPVLAAFLAARLLPGQRLCVGLSGGRDSVVLLHALLRLRSSDAVPFRLGALHVHHGLSPDADAWANFCADFCQRNGVPLEIVRVTVPSASGEGLEAAARRQRHAVFASCAADWLALAHHRDDQAETVLFRLLRGAGVAGAAGMAVEREQAGGPRLLRPLLDLPRAVLTRYAELNSLAWIEDASNLDGHYRRNHLRREVLPRIEAKFPGAARALARAAQHFREAAQLLDELAQADREAVAGERSRIDLARFNALSKPRARNLLRLEWAAAGFRAPEARWIDEALRQLARVGPDSETCVATPEGELHVYRGEIHVLALPPEVPPALPWRGESELAWGGGRVLFVPTRGGGLCRRLLDLAPVVIRPRQGGERLHPDRRRPGRPLRKLFQEAGVPPWERRGLPLLWCGERLAWVGGFGSDAAFSCPPAEDGLTVIWESGLRLPPGETPSRRRAVPPAGG